MQLRDEVRRLNMENRRLRQLWQQADGLLRKHRGRGSADQFCGECGAVTYGRDVIRDVKDEPHRVGCELGAYFREPTKGNAR